MINVYMKIGLFWLFFLLVSWGICHWNDVLGHFWSLHIVFWVLRVVDRVFFFFFWTGVLWYGVEWAVWISIIPVNIYNQVSLVQLARRLSCVFQID